MVRPTNGFQRTAPHAADTIHKYQKGKHVMAEPQVPLTTTQ